MTTDIFNIQRDAIKPEWGVPSDSYGWRAVLRNLAPLLLLLAAAPVLAERADPLAWILAPFIGLAMYRVSVVMHDCAHRTLFTRSSTNERVGMMLGAVTGIDFHCYRRQHWRHHRRFGAAGDPQGFQYRRLRGLSRSGYWRHVLKPLTGWNLQYVIGESWVAPRNLLRLTLNGEWPWSVAVQLLILVIVTGGGNHWSLAALPFVSTATFGLFFSQLRGMAEHGARVAPSENFVRSHRGTPLERILLYDVNFNFHREHHAYPEIPSIHLAAVHRALSGSPAPRSMFRTLSLLAPGTR